MMKHPSSGWTRRDFVTTAALAIAGGPLCTANRGLAAQGPGREPSLFEARYYEPLDDGRVRCDLCPWHCIVPPGQRGKCGVRENRGGRYYSLVYGHPCAIHNDPIEKKPFFHVYPGSMALSIATVGCNIECKFCQNWDIAQARPEQVPAPFRAPGDIVEMARQLRSRTIAYTYSEPTVFNEYVTDTARAAKEHGVGNVVVSNGFIAQAPLEELCSVVTAIKIDLKSFSQQFYAKMCSGRLTPVLDTLKTLSQSDTWYEIVVLLVPTKNDNMEEIKRMSSWIATELGPDVPLHFTRFHPAYKIRNLPPTSPNTLHQARDTAMNEGCHFVYTGNMPGSQSENTYCPQCNATLVERYGHMTTNIYLKNGLCPDCGASIPGIWN